MLSSFLGIIIPCLVQVRFSCQEQLEEVKLSFPLRIPGSLGIRGIGDAMVLLTSVGWLIGLVTKDPWLVAWSEPKEYFTHLGTLTRSWPPWRSGVNSLFFRRTSASSTRKSYCQWNRALLELKTSFANLW